MSSSDNGFFQSSLTNQSPPSRIFFLGEKLPSQFLEGLHSLQRETVEIILKLKEEFPNIKKTMCHPHLKVWVCYRHLFLGCLEIKNK